jgi:TFIIF-interacting CTD phosphatase-like protein
MTLMKLSCGPTRLDIHFRVNAGIRSPPCDDRAPPNFTFSLSNAQDPEDNHKGYNVWIRPHARWTLRFLSLFANLHVFTAATQDYADGIIDKAFPPGLFKSRWYRPSCVDPKGYGKDLRQVVASSQRASSTSDKQQTETESGGGNLEHALLVDDRLHNRVDTQHLFHIPSYHPENPLDMELIRVLVYVLLWM